MWRCRRPKRKGLEGTKPADPLVLHFQPPALHKTIYMCYLSLPGHRAFLKWPQETNTGCVNKGVTTMGNQSSALLGILWETAGNTPQNCAIRDRALILGGVPLGWRLLPRAYPVSHWKTNQVLLLLESTTCRQSRDTAGVESSRCCGLGELSTLPAGQGTAGQGSAAPNV